MIYVTGDADGEKLQFKKWFAGHWHKNILLNDNLQILLNEVQEIG